MEEYRYLIIGEILQKGDEWYYNRSWFPIYDVQIGCEYSNSATKVRRKIYKYLTVEDIMHKGDEYLNSEDVWTPVHAVHIGKKVFNPTAIVRRKITKGEEIVKKSTEETTQLKGNYIIGSIDKMTGEFSISNKPAIHTSFLSAQVECERLSRLHTNKKFVVYQAKGICQAVQVGWE